MKRSGNIFGKQVHDYQHLTKLKNKGLLDKHLETAKAQGRPLLFDGQLGAKPQQLLTDNDGAAGIGYLTSNLQAIQSEIVEIMYMNYRLPELVPINKTVPRGALAYGYNTIDYQGEADFIDTYGTNANASGSEISTHTTPIKYGGMYAQWSDQELHSAIYGGIPLQEARLKAATRGCLIHIEKVAIQGAPKAKVAEFKTGLINDPIVAKNKMTFDKPIESEDDPIKKINATINQFIEQTDTILAQNRTPGFTIYLPPQQYNYLATTKYNVTADKSMLEYLKTYNAWNAMTGLPITFKVLNELKDGAGKGKPRMMITFNNNEVMEIAQPVEPYVTRIIDEGFYYKAPMMYSISALNFKLPAACLYVDGI